MPANSRWNLIQAFKGQITASVIVGKNYFESYYLFCPDAKGSSSSETLVNFYQTTWCHFFYVHGSVHCESL